MKLYERWVRVNDMSIRECHNNINNNVDDVEEAGDEEYYCSSLAQVSGSQALVLLHQYLQKITVDRFTRLTPAWMIKNIKDSNSARLWRGLGLESCQEGFQASVQLPHKTPLHLPVQGAVRSSKVLARRSAALEV